MSNLRSGHTSSCGCKVKDNFIGSRKTHGQSTSRLYSVWSSMKSRCNNKKVHNYTRYGGRGIKVCSEWSESFLLFKEWAYNNGYTEGLTIDREDNDIGYTPTNCRFVTVAVQNINKGTMSTNTSGHTGVNLHGGMWVARIRVHGSMVQIGRYQSKEDAYRARVDYIENNNLEEHRRALRYE